MLRRNQLPQPEQLYLTEAALRQAAKSLVTVAETLAAEIEAGSLPAEDGSEALRLFVHLVRASTQTEVSIGAELKAARVRGALH